MEPTQDQPDDQPAPPPGGWREKWRSLTRGQREVALYFLIGLPPAIYFVLDSSIDLWGAQLGHTRNFGYPTSYEPFWLGVRRVIQFCTALLPILVAYSVYCRVAKGKHRFGLDGKAAAYLLLCVIVGPWLLANEVLKDNWGRPRPAHLDVTIGTKQYAPPLLIDDQCDKNCSFISGEASFGYIWVALAFVPTFMHRRRQLFIFGLGIGTVAGIMRIYQGGHFPSDVWYAALFMIATAWGLHKLFYETGWPDRAAPAARRITASGFEALRAGTLLIARAAKRARDRLRRGDW